MGYAWAGGCRIEAFYAGGMFFGCSMTTGRLMHEAWAERDS